MQIYRFVPPCSPCHSSASRYLISAAAIIRLARLLRIKDTIFPCRNKLPSFIKLARRQPYLLRMPLLRSRGLALLPCRMHRLLALGWQQTTPAGYRVATDTAKITIGSVVARMRKTSAGISASLDVLPLIKSG
jgi:hypothetical protein